MLKKSEKTVKQLEIEGSLLKISKQLSPHEVLIITNRGVKFVEDKEFIPVEVVD